MFPIGDDNSDRRTQPIVNYAILGLNILVFLILQQLGSNEAFDNAFSLVPREITNGIDLVGPQVIQVGAETARINHFASPLPVYFNFFSSMFMHGDIMHIFGNMLFLFIFGDNLENMLGHVRYLVFYILCGFAAAAAQIIMGPDSIIPMLGASGAISGVLGGYLLLFPSRPVRALIFNMITTVPAFVAIGIWIVYQLVLGYLTPSGGGGVAYAAHIGGFIAGVALIKPFMIGRKN
ncbi:MAG: rhomboid family intramembrane serine protease [Chloracidobacterium sp.]|nr:rhomboid family intramembrane serine protease [Chloracidobacterium sp.]